jgi:probable rRNA maturation factor
MRESRKAAAAGSLRVDVQTRVRAWAPRARDIATWAGTAIGRRAAGGELGVRVVGSAESRRLNGRYRGKDEPTNVLSFPPAPLPGRLTGAPAARGGLRTDDSARPGLRPLGDLVICAQVVRSEAREQGKPLEAHWAHLVVHGALHLIGYDHELETEAKRMERREIAVLRRLGFANPYRISS